IHSIREAQIEDICIDAEAVGSHVRAERCEALSVSNDFIETDVYIRIDSLQTNLAGNTSQPTRHPEIEVPGCALCDRGRRRHFFRRSEEHTSELQSRSDLVC